MTHHARIHGLLCVPSIAWATETKSKKRKSTLSLSEEEEDTDAVMVISTVPTPATAEPTTPAATTTATHPTAPPNRTFGSRLISTPNIAPPAEIPAAPTITFPNTTDIFVDASTLSWLEETWENRQYWSAPELPEHFFYWQHGQSCYFTKGDTLKRMNSDYRLYIVSKQQDDQEREANRLKQAAKGDTGKGNGGKGGKGKTGKGGKGKGKGKG